MSRLLRVSAPAVDAFLYAFIKGSKRDALVFHDGNKVVSHAVFQKHGDALKMYHLYTHKDYRGRGIGKQTAEALIEYARGKKGINWLRFGGGGDEAVRKIYENHLVPSQQRLGIRCAERLGLSEKERKYWIRLNP